MEFVKFKYQSLAKSKFVLSCGVQQASAKEVPKFFLLFFLSSLVKNYPKTVDTVLAKL